MVLSAQQRFYLLRGVEIENPDAQWKDADTKGEGHAHQRLALVNVDWSQLGAADIFAIFRSFAQDVGSVQEVTVYQSLYGQHCKAQSEYGEALHRYNFDTDRLDLRRYFCVATFDSAETATHVYDSCNGVDLGSSCYPLDLRFVPTSTDFAHLKVRDTASSLPSDYQPGAFNAPPE